jgi:hypothetical protein
MPSEMFEAGVSREMFSTFVKENSELQTLNKNINEVVEQASLVFREIVTTSEKQREEFIKKKSPVLIAAKVTQSDLPRIVKARIISEGLQGDSKTLAYRHAVKYFRLKLLHDISGFKLNVSVNRFFDDSLYKSPESSVLKTAFDFSGKGGGSTSGGGSTPSSPSISSGDSDKSSKQHSDSKEEE